MKNKKLFAILTLVCFMFTLMPVAAFAAATDLDNTRSVLFLDDNKKNVLVKTNGAFETTDFEVALRTVAGNTGSVSGSERLYIWATENGAVSPAVEFTATAGATAATENIANVASFKEVADGAVFTLTFARGGEFTIHAGFAEQGEDTLADVKEFTTAAGTVTVIDTTANPDNYDMDVTGAANKEDTGYAYTDFEAYITNVVPNNVSTQYVLNFEETNGGNALIGKTVIIATDSANLTVTPETAVTDVLGRVKINVSAAREGVYSIYVTVDGKTFVIGANCGNTQAAYIETVDEPDHLVALWSSADALVTFAITDINGNAVKDAGTVGNGADGIYNLDPTNKTKAKYLFFVEKPAAATLTNADLSLDATSKTGEYALRINDTLDAEGKYVVKAILDNGSVATASWEVKRFETPVELLIDAPATVELGTDFGIGLSYLDANGVEKDATDAKVAATGYAIYTFGKVNGVDTVTVKTDEKYAGQTITLTAVSEMYDLIDVEEVKVAAEAVAIEFADDTLEVDVNNKVKWNVVDEEGNKVTLTDVADYKVKYVVLDKPVDAKVSVYDLTGADFDGDGKMALTSDKIGNVTIQVVAQVKLKASTNNATLAAAQYKYYTGVEVFAVGNADKGDVVVMSVGSNEIVINDEVATIDAEPIVANNRTFVPFRALAEAFGAEVAYDEATQAVTAELNGVTIVMTIGSAEYTINGEAATMDVAPFINGSRTMVPVRFAAQAFGIKVIPTYNQDGTTADIVFNL